jgi:hypothetical protein
MVLMLENVEHQTKNAASEGGQERAPAFRVTGAKNISETIPNWRP